VIQPTSPTQDQTPLPPFCSATKFPAIPKPEKLEDLYPECIKALIEANQARDIHKKSLSSKKIVAGNISAAISQIEQDLTIEAETRAKLHTVNEKLIEALREMEKMAGDITGTVDEAHHVQRFDLLRLIAQLRSQMSNWRTFKLRQIKTLATRTINRNDGKRNG
jgi:hypothetical protein